MQNDVKTYRVVVPMVRKISIEMLVHANSCDQAEQKARAADFDVHVTPDIMLVNEVDECLEFDSERPVLIEEKTT